MHKHLLPLGLAALMTVSAFAQNTPLSPTLPLNLLSGRVLTLPVALELAMTASPDLAAAEHETRAQAGAVRQAGIMPNPEIAALVEDTRRATRTTTVQINQPVELGGKRDARLEAALRSQDAAIAELRAKRAEVRAEVIAAFYDALAAQERYRLAESSVELAQRATAIASKRVAAGKVSPVEATKAKVAESGVRVELAQAASDLANARQRLAASWGGTVPSFERLDGNLSVLPEISSLQALAAQLEQSPALLRARHEVARRQALSDVERSRQIPDVVVSIGAKRDEQVGRNQAIVGITIPLPLFDRNQGNRQEAVSRTDKARDELAATLVRITNALSQAYERFRTVSREVELLRADILPGAQSAYDAATTGYEYGKFNFLDVLDAQRTLFQARSQYLKALSEAHRARAEIDRILGVIDYKQEQK